MIKVIKVIKTKPIVIQATLLEITDLEKNNIIDVIGIEVVTPTSSDWTCTVEAKVELKKEATKDLLVSSEIAMLFFTKLFNIVFKLKGDSK
jgi:hypothetical protein